MVLFIELQMAIESTTSKNLVKNLHKQRQVYTTFSPIKVGTTENTSKLGMLNSKFFEVEIECHSNKECHSSHKWYSTTSTVVGTL